MPKSRMWLAASTALVALTAANWLAPAQAADRAEQMKEHRGGTMRVLARSAGGSIDPQVNYTLQYWQVYQSLYDGLTGFKKAAGSEAFTVVPDLAEALPAPENGGKTYVFKLRSGIKFSNGQDVTVKDVVASFQRLFKVLSPTAGSFYAGIVGADKCIATPATCTLDGVVGDEAAGTITFNLVNPDAELFYKLAVPHATILPADSPPKDVGTIPLPGTGTYMMSAYDPNKGITIVRNPHFKEWSVDAQPEGFVDAINYEFGLTEEAAVTAVANGQADWMFDEPPADRLAEIGTKYAKQVHLTPLTAIWYLPMNTKLPPFDNVKVRQALNYAIDRKAVVGLIGGANLATPTCQILPPGFPGYEAYCPYSKDPGAKWTGPDMAKAKQLVEESGTKGQKVTIIPEEKAVSQSVGVYIQSVLKELGYDASVKPISPNIQFTYIQNTNNNVQISVSQWYQDYPAASDFLYVLLGCESYHPGSDSSINIAGFCDEAINNRMKEALALGVTDQPAADKQWAQIDKDVTDLAPWVPLFNPKHVDFTSQRLGNFTFSAQFYFLLANSWVQ